ncbi:unnamed protein product [Caenorhabditis nigoni]|uniref:Probable prefoldin subunit 1 n=1 Tax=Caenorhabditis nigoni TaxID=1611254 RepID=A0A2G5U433_9PELO|nr:hypothetical protein B9Z55_013957 [Caenorhabditis nigoni]
MADEEISKAFRDLQFKTNETRMRIVQGEQNKKVNHQKMRISESTKRNLVGLNEDLKYYRSVGRMFLLTDKASEIARHEAEAKQSKDKIEAIDKQKEYLEKGLVEAESNLRELIQSRR